MVELHLTVQAVANKSTKYETDVEFGQRPLDGEKHPPKSELSIAHSGIG
jgi:hypothetical protein